MENKVHIHRPNSMNNFGTMLDDIGMSDALQDLAVRFVSPIAHKLFPGCGADSIDSYVTVVIAVDPPFHSGAVRDCR